MSRGLPNARISDHPSIRELQITAYGMGNNATRNSGGSIELAFMRGFEGGYLQAMEDYENGEMKKRNSRLPNRSQ